MKQFKIKYSSKAIGLAVLVVLFFVAGACSEKSTMPKRTAKKSTLIKSNYKVNNNNLPRNNK